MATEEDWASYARAVVDVAPPDREPFRLVPDEVGTTGRWPDGLDPPVVVVTAWNPDGVPVPPGDNRAANLRLVAELDRLGLTHWPAVGRDLDSALPRGGRGRLGPHRGGGGGPRPPLRPGGRLRVDTGRVVGGVVHRRAPPVDRVAAHRATPDPDLTGHPDIDAPVGHDPSGRSVTRTIRW